MTTVLISTYLISIIFTWGALVADLQSIGSKQFADNNYRHDLGITMMFSLVPIANVFIATLGTGFMEHGWRLTRRES